MQSVCCVHHQKHLQIIEKKVYVSVQNVCTYIYIFFLKTSALVQVFVIPMLDYYSILLIQTVHPPIQDP